MQQPNIIEYWTEKATAEARQQSERETTRKHVLEALALRFVPLHILPQMRQSPLHRTQILLNQLLPYTACCRPCSIIL